MSPLYIKTECEHCKKYMFMVSNEWRCPTCGYTKRIKPYNTEPKMVELKALLPIAKTPCYVGFQQGDIL